MGDIPENIQVPNIDRVTDCTFNPEGTLLAFLYIDGSVRIFEADETRKFHLIYETQPCCRRATSISFASAENGAIFSFADETGRTYLFQRIKLTEFKQAMTFHHHKAPINCLAFAPLSLCFAAASSDGYVSITFCEQQNWSVQTVRISDKPVTSVTWSSPQYMTFIESPNTSTNVKFAAGAADGFFTVFQSRGPSSWAQDGQPIRAHEGALNSIAWRPTAGFARYEIATCGADGLVKLWTCADGKWACFEICKCEEEPVALKWSACGFVLSISSGTNTVTLYREVTNENWQILEAK